MSAEARYLVERDDEENLFATLTELVENEESAPSPELLASLRELAPGESYDDDEVTYTRCVRVRLVVTLEVDCPDAQNACDALDEALDDGALQDAMCNAGDVAIESAVSASTFEVVS